MGVDVGISIPRGCERWWYEVGGGLSVGVLGGLAGLGDLGCSRGDGWKAGGRWWGVALGLEGG